MLSILDKEEITQYDLEQLISLKVEESIYLDFKQAGSLDFSKEKKLEIGKDVSAFANSAGGLIIYGIKEDNHVADSFSFVNGNNFTKEWIEQVIQSGIQRKIEGLIIIPIRVDNDLEKSIYVVKIPESNLAPHMTNKKFYKRYNFESVQMEEYEIRNLYNRKEKTELIIHNVPILQPKYENKGRVDEIILFPMGFQVENIGKVIERYFKIVVTVNFDNYTVKWDKLNGYNVSRSFVDGISQFSISNSSPIFPDEITNIGDIEFGVPTSYIPQITNQEKLTIRLLYMNEFDEIEMPLNAFINK